MTSTALEAQAQKTRNIYILSTALTAAIAGFLFGYDGAIMSGAILYMSDQFHFDAATLGFVMSSSVIGCIFGPFVGAWFCDKIGREKTILVCAALLGVGALMTAIASTITVFTIFRIVGGFAIGLGSIAAPMYIAEVAPPKMRGKLGLTFQLAVVIGSAAAGFITSGIGHYLSPELAWRWMFASQLIIVVPLAAFVFMLAPSPRWLAEKGRFDEALDVLNKVHGPELAASELAEIKESVNEEQGGWGELFAPGVRFAIVVGLLLAFFNNWTGWSAMGGYVPKLIEMSGVGNSSATSPSDVDHSVAILQFGFVYGVMTLMTIVSIWLVDKVGRRPLWIFASFMMAGITLATGIVFHFHLHGTPVLLVLMLCTVPHGIALGGLPWLMMSELYPNRVRAKAVAVTTTFLWMVIFSCGQLFPIFVKWSNDAIGSPGGVFWLFTIICLFSALFGLTIMPETKGRTLEDIASSWTKK
jgi:SP family arabinose:H+ symporter-like MFS transporter